MYGFPMFSHLDQSQLYLSDDYHRISASSDISSPSSVSLLPSPCYHLHALASHLLKSLAEIRMIQYKENPRLKRM